MKIGILTLPFNNNYGGYLQAYALMTVLKQMGHHVELIYRRQNRRPLKWQIQYFIKNTIKILLGRKHVSLIPNQEKELRAKGKLMMTFVDNHIIPRTKPLYSSSALKQYANNRYDAIIVGSDQVWRPDYVPNIEDFFLTFLSDKTKRIAYAASFGTDTPSYTNIEKEECGKGIELFDLITVREKSAIQIINDFEWICRKGPIQVLDPAFLLPKNHYVSLIISKQSNMKGKIFCYILDSNGYIKNIVSKVCCMLRKESSDFLDEENRKKGDCLFPSIELWLSYFRDADFVVTDSFHGTVFSIIFNKPFIVYLNEERGISRFSSLLSMLGLNGRIIHSANDIEKSSILSIDWDNVNTILRDERDKSLNCLIEILQDNNIR